MLLKEQSLRLGSSRATYASKDPEYRTHVSAFFILGSELSEGPAFPISAAPELGMEEQHVTQITYNIFQQHGISRHRRPHGSGQLKISFLY